MNRSVLPLVIVSLALSACAVSPQSDDRDLGTAQQPQLTENSLTQNSLTQNSLVMASLENDPASIDVMKYLVSCALPSGSSLTININGTDTTFNGQIGVAPDWATSSCDSACQAVVSSCVISRVNYLGQVVDISVRGSNSALAASSTEISAYPYREGAYYGTIFGTQQMYACTSPSSTLITRVCGPDYATAGCGAITILGNCGDVCDTVDATAGYYGSCHDATRTGSTYPSGTVTYSAPVTVFRQ
jgi:hypothetical protein